MRQVTLFLLVFLFSGWQSLTAEVRVVFDPGSPTKGIQEAITKAATEGGGTVFVPKGNYVISTSIVIPKTGNLIIYGEGNASVIEVESEYAGLAASDLKKGESMFTAKNPELFRINDKVVIIDDKWHGEDETTVAKVIGKNGNVILLDAPLIKNYTVEKNARAVHTFHMLMTEGCSKDVVVQGITVRDLQFIGGLRKNFQGFELWQVNGGIVLMGDNLRIENCVIRDIPADAIFAGGGFKQKGNICITGCLIENSGHRGIHLGNDPRDVSVSGNHFNKIGGIGIYLCHGCQRVVITGNTICDIGTYETNIGTVDFITSQKMEGDDYKIKTQVAGIGGLGGGGVEPIDHDKYDVISNNIIYNSRGSGISFLKWFQEEGGRPGENMIIKGNNLYQIEKSAVFIFAAQSIQVSENMMVDCNTGIECSESLYCFLTGNTLRNCHTAFHFYSNDEKFPTMKNVSCNNMLINCKAAECFGKWVSDHTSVNNHTINY